MSESRLFKSLKIGNVDLQHRLAMAPLTRMRATEDRVPTPMMKEYYSQRASVPGTLIITEGTLVNSIGGGFPGSPGIWRNDQIEAWRTITDEVHRKGCFIYCQLFAFGRAASAEVAEKEGVPILAPSATAFPGGAMPRAMTAEEIKQTIVDFGVGAKNAIDAGFDGVECHTANGYLLDQFLQDVSNHREDEYGGSVENRSRFPLEIFKAMVDTVGPDRVGLRASPWNTFQGMRMADPIPQFTDFLKKANALKPAYLSLIEARVAGSVDVGNSERLDFAYELWDGPLLVAGGYTIEDARRLVDSEYPDKDIVVVFGRFFISNPDLVYRIKEGLALTKHDRSTFYVPQSPIGYVDYPFTNEFLASAKA